jgi:hypothetical protein
MSSLHPRWSNHLLRYVWCLDVSRCAFWLAVGPLHLWSRHWALRLLVWMWAAFRAAAHIGMDAGRCLDLGRGAPWSECGPLPGCGPLRPLVRVWAAATLVWTLDVVPLGPDVGRLLGRCAYWPACGPLSGCWPLRPLVWVWAAAPLSSK